MPYRALLPLQNGTRLAAQDDSRRRLFLMDSRMDSRGGQPSDAAAAYICHVSLAFACQTASWLRRNLPELKAGSAQRDIGRIFLLHADHIIAGVNMMDFARHSRRQV